MSAQLTVYFMVVVLAAMAGLSVSKKKYGYATYYALLFVAVTAFAATSLK